MKPQPIVRLTPGKRVLFLTKDPELIRRQLAASSTCRWPTCRRRRPARRHQHRRDDAGLGLLRLPARRRSPANAYAGLIVDGERLFPSATRSPTATSRSSSPGCARASAARARPPRSARSAPGIRIAIAASFAPIHARNNINLGMLMGDHDDAARGCRRARASRSTSSPRGYDPITRADHRVRRPVPVLEGARRAARSTLPALATPAAADDHGREDPRAPRRRRRGRGERFVKPGDAVVVARRRRLLPRVHHRAGARLPRRGVRRGLHAPEPRALRGLRGPPDLRRRGARGWRRSCPRSRSCATCSASSSATPACATSRPTDGVSPGICHEVAREQMIEPGDFIQATDCHTCMGGANNALAWGVGATEYAALIHSGFTQVEVPESIRFELIGQAAAERHRQGRDAPHPARLRAAAGDAQPRHGVRRPGRLDAVDGRARDARQHGDRVLGAQRHRRGRRGDLPLDRRAAPGRRRRRGCARAAVEPDAGAVYAGGVHVIDLAAIAPMVAAPGRSRPRHRLRPDQRRASRRDRRGPDRHRLRRLLHRRQDRRPRLLPPGDEGGGRRRPQGRRRASTSSSSSARSRSRATPASTATSTSSQRPACASSTPAAAPASAAAPGVSETADQVTVSAINRNYKGRSGPGKLYLASPLTVAASAFTGTHHRLHAGDVRAGRHGALSAAVVN